MPVAVVIDPAGTIVQDPQDFGRVGGYERRVMDVPPREHGDIGVEVGHN